MNGRTSLYVAAMTVLGVVSFALFGYLVELRQSQPVAYSREAGVIQEADVFALVGGVGASAQVAHDELGGHRGEAMHALDAALRAAVVGSHAARGELVWAFDHARTQLEEARIDVQIGEPDDARAHLAAAAQAMTAARDTEPGARGVPPEERWDAYSGAGLLNALGSRIGEVNDIERSGGRTIVTVTIGGAHDVFGFIDLGGSTITVDAERLLFGRTGRPGKIHVVAPTSTSTAAEVEKDLGGPTN